MRASLNDILERNKIMVIDGAMSTALEELGAESGSICCRRMLHYFVSADL